MVLKPDIACERAIPYKIIDFLVVEPNLVALSSNHQPVGIPLLGRVGVYPEGRGKGVHAARDVVRISTVI